MGIKFEIPEQTTIFASNYEIKWELRSNVNFW